MCTLVLIYTKNKSDHPRHVSISPRKQDQVINKLANLTSDLQPQLFRSPFHIILVQIDFDSIWDGSFRYVEYFYIFQADILLTCLGCTIIGI